jgi:hypothetical protein
VLLVLFVFGLASLPLVATVVDGRMFDSTGIDSWVVPVQLVAMAALGALVGWLVPVVAGRDATRRRGVAVGAAAGVGFAVLGLVLWFLLLSGI